MSAEQILITTLSTAKVSFVYVVVQLWFLKHLYDFISAIFQMCLNVPFFFQVGQAVKTISGEDRMRTSEPTYGSMEQRRRTWMWWCLMHPRPCGGMLLCLMPSSLIVRVHSQSDHSLLFVRAENMWFILKCLCKSCCLLFFKMELSRFLS